MFNWSVTVRTDAIVPPWDLGVPTSDLPLKIDDTRSSSHILPHGNDAQVLKKDIEIITRMSSCISLCLVDAISYPNRSPNDDLANSS